MVIQVDNILPNKQEYFINLIESIPSPKFTKCPRKAKFMTTLLFDVEGDCTVDEAKAIVKKTIKSDVNGRALAFRVVEEGKPF